MGKKERKPLVCVLGGGVLGERISESLGKKCRVMREIPQNKRTNYIFSLSNNEEPKIREALALAVLNRAKFLYLTPQTQVDRGVDLVFEYAKKFNLDARVVRAPAAVFKNPNNQRETSYIDNSLEKILEAMFGGQTRGGLFFLQEPSFSNSIKEIQEEKANNIPQQRTPIFRSFSFKKVVLIILGVFLIPPLLTLIFAVMGLLQLLLFEKAFMGGEPERGVFLIKIAMPSFALSQKTLKITTFELTLLGKKDLVQNLENLISAGNEISKGGYHLSQAMLLLREPPGNSLPNKSFYSNENIAQAKTELLLTQEGLIRAEFNFASINEGFPILGKEIKDWDQNIRRQRKLLEQALLFLNTAAQILGADGKKTYLVLLQNNMELRPTGGFIGSYGLLSFEKGRLLGFEVFDVYSADGQLRGHVEPPIPIKKYLDQPHWFLRDSNWDPDFSISANKAAWFLEKEIGQKVDGVMAIDIPLVALMLSAIGGVNLPDYQEIITQENLYQKAQFYAQENFFPGSRQKSDFLGTLARGMINKLESDKNIPWILVFNSLMAGIEEKHLLFAFNDPGIHSLFSLNNLTGAVVFKKQGGEEMLDDFLMVVEANLGVNKVNYFVKKEIASLINVGEIGETSGVLRLTYTNQSAKEEYKNYLRIISPKGTRIKKIEFDGQELKEVDGEEAQDKSIFGFLVRIPARSQKIVSIDYQLQNPMSIGRGLNVYSLRFLKQPGTLEDPLAITVRYPSFFTVQEVIRPAGSRVISAPQAVNIITDLSRDREFEIRFLNNVE